MIMPTSTTTAAMGMTMIMITTLTVSARRGWGGRLIEVIRVCRLVPKVKHNYLPGQRKDLNQISKIFGL